MLLLATLVGLTLIDFIVIQDQKQLYYQAFQTDMTIQIVQFIYHTMVKAKTH